ncbi:DUF2628 domain-containing protein, partial [Salmonella enterica subsp. enterica serovar Kentucky]|nr:DUF2628 domain-containing protein [Salmonella enterica subsp. enterica serovar Kentucky]
RTGNRHDLAVEPPAPTVLQKLVDEKQGHVVSVGKIADIYANCVSPEYKQAFKALKPRQRLTIQINFIAFFFSWIYLFVLGLWKK